MTKEQKNQLKELQTLQRKERQVEQRRKREAGKAYLREKWGATVADIDHALAVCRAVEQGACRVQDVDGLHSYCCRWATKIREAVEKTTAQDPEDAISYIKDDEAPSWAL